MGYSLRKLFVLLWLLPTLAYAGSQSAQLYYRRLIEADNPTHFWPLDETSGTAAADRCGSTGPDACGTTALDGVSNSTYTGGFTLNGTGLPGKPQTNYVTLNGTTGYVAGAANVADTRPLGNFSSTVDWSMEVWVNSSSTALQDLVSLMNPGNSNDSVFQLYIGNSGAYTLSFAKDTAAHCGSASGYGTSTGGTYTANAWHHLVVTTVGASSTTLTNAKLYDNNSLAFTITSFTGAMCQTALGSTEVDLGREADNNFYVTGKVADLAFYRFALSTTQIAAHYNIGLNAGGGFPRLLEWKHDRTIMPVSFELPITRSRGGKKLPLYAGPYDH